MDDDDDYEDDEIGDGYLDDDFDAGDGEESGQEGLMNQHIGSKGL